MQRHEIRIECLKLVFRKDRAPADNLRDAQILERYVLEDFKEASDKEIAAREKPDNRKARKIIGNPDILT